MTNDSRSILRKISHYESLHEYELIMDVFYKNGVSSVNGWYCIKIIGNNMTVFGEYGGNSIRETTIYEDLRDEVVAYMFQHFIDDKYIQMVLDYNP